MSTTKSERMNVRIAPEDNALFRRAAEWSHESLSDFVLAGGRERAERILADRTQFVLDAAAWEAFNSALERPAEAKPEVVDLFRRPRPPE